MAARTLTGADVEDLCVGNVLMPPAGFATLRMAALAAGLPHTVSLQTVNRQCASGLQAVANTAHRIAAGEITVGVGAGVESMSQFPMHQMKLPEQPFGGDNDSGWHTMQATDHAMDCLLPMGVTSDTVAAQFDGLDRDALDAFAVQSHQRAARAQAQGKFDAEMVPVGAVTKDDGVRPDTTAAVLSKLKPAFTPTGPTTAGNSSQTTDGAAAVVLMTRREARRRSLKIMAVWRGMSVTGVPPAVMGIGPAVAVPAVLRQTNLTTKDVDVWELNEAFGSQAVHCIRKLQLDPAKVNPNGGAIALGHPLGATGARLLVTLVHELHRRRGARYGACIFIIVVEKEREREMRGLLILVYFGNDCVCL